MHEVPLSMSFWGFGMGTMLAISICVVFIIIIRYLVRKRRLLCTQQHWQFIFHLA